MTEAYIFDSTRTPRGKGKKNGTLHEITALQLATQQLEAIRDRNNLDTSYIDDVILGCVSPVGEQGANIARAAAINANYAETASGFQVNRFCASGLEATNLAAAKVMSGEADLAIGGGVEAMSRVPMGSDGGAMVADPEMAFDHYFVPQGVSADLIATVHGYSRDDVDAYAVESQKRAGKAWEEGRFKNSVVPVKNQLGLTQLDHDELMRPQTDMQSLASLNPAFKDLSAFVGFDTVAIQKYPHVEKINFVHHAGNSSGIVDGAAAILIGTKEMGEKLGLKPRARIRAMASIGSEPTIMLTGPAPSARKALKKAGMSPEDIDLFEMNEAFAAVVLRFMEDLGVPHDKTNVNGGAIAMGHPLGATGAMILGTVLDELERTGKGTGLATLCVGGGMGTATIIERV
ncbi:MAG: acetyl-CoA acetyltransferase [Maricaulis sp.]|jgi:acetyl-CoA C-acetyltransferase|nr:acetyl-CoA acetyltransferase [Maricaulis sp.]HAQ36750.1 acetyl-CoA C-acetyltransferase [Alphaproteobacteria bacterium]